VAVVELHAAARVGQHLGTNAFEFQHLFFGHALSWLKAGAPERHRETHPSLQGHAAADSGTPTLNDHTQTD
jgi:hypothetical protein